jgi:hypothetical protein
MPRVPGFLPSHSGLHFPNDFPSEPLLSIDVLGQEIPIGDASNGLCGGMAFAVRDYFESGIPLPPDATVPSSGVLFNYLVRRLFDSFNLPSGPLIYLGLMNPALPDHETYLSDIGLAPRGRAWIMINNEWPKIRTDLDGGHPSTIGLIEVKSADPFQLGNNHQVLAYGYDLNGADLTIHVYDPNFPNDDNITLSLSIADPQHTTLVTYPSRDPVLCFFRSDYTFSSPPSLAPPLWPQQHDWRWCGKCSGLFWAGGNTTAGVCPAGGPHARGTTDYALVIDAPGAPGQTDWRWCDKCSGLFWAGGNPNAGRCPAGAAHVRGSSNYTLAMDTPDAPGQHQWRWCNRCSGLFWADGDPAAGSCSAGGQHTRGPSDYSLLM